MKRLFLFLISLSLLSNARAADVTATAPQMDSPAQLNTIIAGMSAGDTLNLPQHTSTWSTAVVIDKPINVIGEGAGLTNINFVCTDDTQHKAFQVNVNHNATTHDVPFWRISGLSVTLQGGGLTKNINQFGLIHISGSAINGRLDHCTITGANSATIIMTVNAFCVIDHCRINIGTGNVHVNHPNWQSAVANNFSGTKGNGSWADDPYFGTYKFVYWEDNYVTTASASGTFDGTNGARFVVRHNRTQSRVGGHGSESGGNPRGARNVENYNNIFEGSADSDGPYEVARSGTRTTFNNVVLPFGTNHFNGGPRPFGRPGGNLNRMSNLLGPWGMANGRNPLDDNDATIYQSGLVQSVNTTTHQVTIPISTNVGLNNYVGYSILRSAIAGYSSRNSTMISANTAGSAGGTIDITLAQADDNWYLPIVANEAFQVRRVNVVLDEPGRGRGDKLGDGGTSTPPPNLTVDSSGGTVAYNNAEIEGCFSWNNHTADLGGTAIDGWSTGSNGLMPVRNGREMRGGVFRTGYPPITSPSPPARKVGPDTEMETAIGKPTSFQLGTTEVYGYRYPHPNTLTLGNDDTGGSTSTPRIGTGAPSVTSTFSEGLFGQYTFSTTGFTSPPTMTKAPSPALPSNVTFSTTAGTGQATVSGTPAPGTAGSYGPITITATNGGEVASQNFTLIVNGNNVAPTASISLPLNGSVYTAPATIPINASGNDQDGSVTQVDIFSNGVFIPGGTIPSSGGTFTWTLVPVGSYSLTAKSTDNLGLQGSASTAVGITVAAPTATPTPTPFSPTPTPTPIGPTPTPPARIILQP